MDHVPRREVLAGVLVQGFVILPDQLLALVTDGLPLPGGLLLPMRRWTGEIERLLTETFRRLVLDELVKEERLTEGSREEEGDGRDRVTGSRASGARLLHQGFEVDPLTCIRSGAEMKVISVITAPALVDRLLRHVRAKGKVDDDPFSTRAPPAA